MLKAVNMKGYKFGEKGCKFFLKGFGMIDTETNEFASFDGKIPYVLSTKKLVESCIVSGWAERMLRVKAV